MGLNDKDKSYYSVCLNDKDAVILFVSFKSKG